MSDCETSAGNNLHPEMTPKAAEAFRRYIEMGPTRTLRKLANEMLSQEQYKTSATALAILNGWSRKYKWQERIATIATEAAERMLREAAEIDADTFLKTSHRLHSDVQHDPETDTVIKIRESVRKPAAKGGASVDVNVNVDVQVRERVEAYARERGLDVDEMIAEAERILAGAS